MFGIDQMEFILLSLLKKENQNTKTFASITIAFDEQSIDCFSYVCHCSLEDIFHVIVYVELKELIQYY